MQSCCDYPLCRAAIFGYNEFLGYAAGSVNLMEVLCHSRDLGLIVLYGAN
jgi:hypothetical protein